MRYQGTDTNISVVQSEKDFKSQFEAQYYREFGFIVEAGEIGKRTLMHSLTFLIFSGRIHCRRWLWQVAKGAPTYFHKQDKHESEGRQEHPVLLS